MPRALGTGITGLDHLIIAVGDLDAAAAGWARLGFTLTPQGRHIGAGTANRCVMFFNDYIELLALADRAETSPLATHLARIGEGGFGVAFATEDADRTEAAWRGVGETVTRRRLERPVGAEGDIARFDNVHLREGALAGLSGFAIRHETSALIRPAHTLDHANSAIALRSLLIRVEDPEETAHTVSRLFGIGAIARADAVLALHLGRSVLLFASPDDVAALVPDAEPGSGAPIVAASVVVRSLDAARAALDAGDVDYEAARDQLRLAPADVSGGLVLDLVEERRPIRRIPGSE